MNKRTLIRHIEGELCTNDAIQVEKWLDESVENRMFYRELVCGLLISSVFCSQDLISESEEEKILTDIQEIHQK